MRDMVIVCAKNHEIAVDRALVWWCPNCLAQPGKPCEDKREGFARQLARPHPARTALRVEADKVWNANRLAAQA